MMPMSFHLLMGSGHFLWKAQLISRKAFPSDGTTDVDRNYVMFKTDGIQIKSPWCRRLNHITGVVKDRGMAGAFKLFTFGNPWYCAAKVGTFSGNGEHTAIGESADVAVSGLNQGHSAWEKVYDLSCFNELSTGVPGFMLSS